LWQSGCCCLLERAQKDSWKCVGLVLLLGVLRWLCGLRLLVLLVGWLYGWLLLSLLHPLFLVLGMAILLLLTVKQVEP
jgi:hypothetical protein